MKKNMAVKAGKVWDTLLIIGFPIVSVLFICAVSVVMREVGKGPYPYTLWNVYAVYVIYLLLFAVFLHRLGQRRANVSWVALGLGGVQIILFYMDSFWKAIYYQLYSTIWQELFLHYFLLGILCVIYVLLALDKCTRKH